MQKKIFLTLLLPLLIIPAYAQVSPTEIPSWVKGVANFWVEGNINDAEFGEAITFLIEQGIFKIDSVAVPQQSSLNDDGKRLYELELNQKDDRINILEKELKDTGLDNSHLLNSVVEKENVVVNMQKLYDQVKIDFNQYKEDYPLKIGNIGGKLVVDYIKELEDRIAELEQ